MTTYININGDVREASSLTVPSDRTFRGAWTFNGNAVEIDMAAARNIHKDNLRADRVAETIGWLLTFSLCKHCHQLAQARQRLQLRSRRCVILPDDSTMADAADV